MWGTLATLENRIPQKTMLELNSLAELKGKSFKEVANHFLQQGENGYSSTQSSQTELNTSEFLVSTLIRKTFGNNFCSCLLNNYI